MSRNKLNLKFSFRCCRAEFFMRNGQLGNEQNYWDGQGQGGGQSQDFNFEIPDQFGQDL